MKRLSLPIVLLTIFVSLPSEGYRILGVFPHNGKSQFMMAEHLLKSLAKRGHQVDVISHFPQEIPHWNYNDVISLQGTASHLINEVSLGNVENILNLSPVHYFTHFSGTSLCQTLGIPEMKSLISDPPRNPPYDLVITVIQGTSCYLAFGHHLKVPIVGIVDSAIYPWVNEQIGNPDNTAYVPNCILGLTDRMTFWERLKNSVATVVHKLQFLYHTIGQDAIVRKYFGKDTPGVRELEKSVALVLANTHYSLNGIKPSTPGVVEVGGLHITETGQELDPELQSWLDESQHGFIYISFGSTLKLESFPKEVLLAIYASLAKISPIQVLMKISDEKVLPPGLPTNVVVLPWLPQLKVLKHKNIRAFVTHGGLMGIQEAVHCGVPVIGIPVFADQHLNIKTLVDKNSAVSLNYKEFTEAKFDAALNSVLNNSSYREAAKKLSAEFLDRPYSAIDIAIFWVEYVIRNGPNKLRSSAVDLAWWQIALLDVYATLLVATSLTTYLLLIILKWYNRKPATKETEEVLNPNLKKCV